MLNGLNKNVKNWYVISTKPRAEKQVSSRLSAIGIENYLPLLCQQRVWHDRKKWIESPLFNSYIFVHIEERNRCKVFDVVGILRYVSIAGEIPVLKDEEIERIKRVCAYLGCIEVENAVLKKGEEVEILSGHFAGIRGHIVTCGDRYKFRISIPALGTYITVEIDEANVKKAS